MEQEQRIWDSEAGPDPLGWHVIGGSHLLAVLRQVEAGESADIVYAELWANADHEHEEPPGPFI